MSEKVSILSVFLKDFIEHRIQDQFFFYFLLHLLFLFVCLKMLDYCLLACVVSGRILLISIPLNFWIHHVFIFWMLLYYYPIFEWFDYNLHWYHSIYIACTWTMLCFLNLWVYSFHQNGNNFGPFFFFKYFFLWFSFSLWGSPFKHILSVYAAQCFPTTH